MILGVGFEVFGQLRDPAGKKCDLHICAAGIFLVQLKLPHVHRITAFCHKRSGTVDEVCLLARPGRNLIPLNAEQHYRASEVVPLFLAPAPRISAPSAALEVGRINTLVAAKLAPRLSVRHGIVCRFQARDD